VTCRCESAAGFVICGGQLQGKPALYNTYHIEMLALLMIIFQRKRWYGSFQPIPDGLVDIMIELSTRHKKKIVFLVVYIVNKNCYHNYQCHSNKRTAY